MQQKYRDWIYVVIVLVVVVVGVSFFLHHTHTTKKQTVTLTGYCVGKTLTSNSTGSCVSDVQTMINYMENSGLTQCKFTNSAELTVDGMYSSATSTQVRSVQEWSECYARQEGFTSNVKETSNVDRSTWGELCTYGYSDPMHSSATGASASIAAGKDAGCARLQS